MIFTLLSVMGQGSNNGVSNWTYGHRGWKVVQRALVADWSGCYARTPLSDVQWADPGHDKLRKLTLPINRYNLNRNASVKNIKLYHGLT